jgi:tetratricopeptide (TPR) repeat protein
MDDGEKLYQTGVTKFLNEEYAEAIQVLSDCAKQSSHPGALRTIGECYLCMGQPRDAVLYLAASIGIRKNPKASLLLAEALTQCGFLNYASEAAQSAIDQLPHYEQARALLAKITELQKHDFEARETH